MIGEVVKNKALFCFFTARYRPFPSLAGISFKKEVGNDQRCGG
jgi:hypothetical protein